MNRNNGFALLEAMMVMALTALVLPLAFRRVRVPSSA